jgi:hypothetical protein
MFSNVFSENVEKCCRPEQATNDNMAIILILSIPLCMYYIEVKQYSVQHSKTLHGYSATTETQNIHHPDNRKTDKNSVP